MGQGKLRYRRAAFANRMFCQVLWFEDGGQTTPARDQDQFIRVSLPLRRFMSVLAQCRMLICNDSGPMHIATALNVPVVAVFGPTEPAWFGPLGQDHHVVIRPEFWCRPCFDYCLFDQPYCSASSMWTRFSKRLSRHSGRCFENRDESQPGKHRPVRSEPNPRHFRVLGVLR